jgi:hypothetical protein
MTLHEYPEVEQGTETWHDLRRGIVTASVIGQLVSETTLGAIGYICPACDASNSEPCQSKRAGAGPIKTMHPERVALAAELAVTVIEPTRNETARTLTRLLVAERITGHTDLMFVSDDMERGWEDEPRARDAYSKHYAPVTEMGFMALETPGWTLGFSPDGLVGDDGLIEIKSRRPKKHLQTILADRVPAENMAQIQAGLLVSGREWCDYISYSGGMPLWTRRVFPDPKWHVAIVAAVEQFETAARDMESAYLAATAGLPMTERVIEVDMVIR